MTRPTVDLVTIMGRVCVTKARVTRIQIFAENQEIFCSKNPRHIATVVDLIKFAAWCCIVMNYLRHDVTSE